MLFAYPTDILIAILFFTLVVLGIIAVIFYAAANKAAHIERQSVIDEQKKENEQGDGQNARST